MGLLNGLLSLPVAYARERGGTFVRLVRIGAGTISLVLGVALAGEFLSGGDLLGQ
jgi:hypothetical protein